MYGAQGCVYIFLGLKFTAFIKSSERSLNPRILNISALQALTLPICVLLMQFGLRNKVIYHVRILIEVGQQDLENSQVGSPFGEWSELHSGFPFCCPEACFCIWADVAVCKIWVMKKLITSEVSWFPLCSCYGHFQCLSGSPRVLSPVCMLHLNLWVGYIRETPHTAPGADREGLALSADLQ